MAPPSNSDFPSLQPRLRPPPDYTRRNIKLRIFMLLACLFLVLGVAERASQPKTWNWLWGLSSEAPDEKVQNRLPPSQNRTAHDPLGTFVTSDDATDEFEEPVADENEGPFDPVARAWEQGWRDVLRALSAEDRELVFQWLYLVRAQRALPDDLREPSTKLLTSIDTFWNDYHARAFQSVATMSADDRVLWVDVLRQINTRWGNEVKPALEALVAGETLTDEQKKAVRGYDQALRELALSQVRDDTVFRPAENDIWFYLLSQAQLLTGETSGRLSPPEVPYVQLFRQAEDYRGTLISVRGKVKQAYRTDASENYLGIDEYYVLTVQPDNRLDSPIIVYALQMPEGFPAIKHRENDGGATKLDEDIAIQGYFYKRLAYPAVGGTYSAPLIVGNEPQWIPHVPASATKMAMTWERVGIIALIAALCAALAMAFIVWRIRKDTEQSLARELTEPETPPRFEGLDVRPSARDALGQMAEQASQEADASQESNNVSPDGWLPENRPSQENGPS